jgi:LuxR family transcriptional regulator, maltose regulon positive regulatory protein
MAAALAAIDRLDTGLARTHLAEVDLQNRRRTSSSAYFDFQRALNARFAVLTEGPARALILLRAPAASAQEPAVLVHANRALQIRLLIGARDLLAARALVDVDGDGPELTPARIDLALAAGEIADASEHLNNWNPQAHDLRALVGHLLREAAVAAAQGDHHAAKTALRTTIASAETDQLRWPFVEVPAALRIFQTSTNHRSRLIDDALLRSARRLDANAQAQLIEPLTDRELTVLEYLPGRLRNQEIADEIYVSVNTLKSHLRNIYRKLDVADRDEAVAKAVQIGLL